jgi:hypothetical protein
MHVLTTLLQKLLADGIVAELAPQPLKLSLEHVDHGRIRGNHDILLVALDSLHCPVQAAVQKEAAVDNCELVMHVERAVVCYAGDALLGQLRDVAAL